MALKRTASLIVFIAIAFYSAGCGRKAPPVLPKQNLKGIIVPMALETGVVKHQHAA